MGYKLTSYDKSRSKGFHTRQFARPSIVDRIGSHEKREEARVSPSHLGKRGLLEFCPRAVDDGHAARRDHLSVSRREGELGMW